jgi:hypothetical protein
MKPPSFKTLLQHCSWSSANATKITQQGQPGIKSISDGRNNYYPKEKE